MFPARSKWLFLTSISAVANQIISNNSLYRDIGPGKGVFLFCKKAFTMVRTQKIQILRWKVVTMGNINRGERQMMAKALKPAVVSS